MATVYSLICWGGLTGKTVTMTIASPCVVSLTTHGLRPGAGIVLSTTGALPTGLTAGTTYYVGNVARGTFNLYDTKANAIAGGATGKINTSGTQSGTHNAKSAIMLGTDLSRYDSTRVYDGIASWNSERSGASAYDTEVAEVLEPFTDTLTAALTLSIPSAKSIMTSKINGVRGAGFHGGVKPTSSLTNLTLENGYVLTTETWLSGSMLTIDRYRDTLDGICLINAASGGVYYLVVLSGGQSRLANSFLTCITANNSGVSIPGALAECVGNRIYNFSSSGINVTPSVSGIFVCNNTVAKCGTGIGTTSSGRGFFYNNIVVGNTTNWSPATIPTGVEGASNNCTPTGQGWSKSGGALINIATTDFTDYTNNNFYPASVSSPQVEAGISPYSYPIEDIAGRERPNYMNGGAEAMDIGADEYDHGYGPHPTLNYRGLDFSGLVAGSTLRVFESGTTTELFSTTSSGTTESWSENAAGSRTVDYTILKDGYLPLRVAGIVVTGAATGGILATPVQQTVSRAWVTPSGLSFGVTATVNTGAKTVAVSAATTVQNWFNFMVQSWRSETSLRNVQFPFSENGPNSFQLADGWQFSSGLTYLSRDGLRYVNSSGLVTDVWAAILSVGVPAGMLVRYEQEDGGTVHNASSIGNIDQLVKVYQQGSFDYTDFLVLKVQGDGYDQAEFDAVATYGILEDQLYVVGLPPTANGIASGTVTGITITDHGASPVTWNSKQFSITITDTGVHSGEQILQYVRGLNNFNYHDLVQTNGTSFKTVRGSVYGDIGASMKGVRVVKADGTTSHPDFNLHTSDDGTTYAPPLPPAAVSATILVDSRVQLYNVTTDTEINNVFVMGTGYSYTITTEASLGDTIRLRVCKLGREAGEAFGIWAGNPMPMLISQPENEIYTAWGIDGSNVPEFSGDVTGHIYIDANDLDGVTTKTRLGAWYSWVLTTEIGIRHFYGAVSYVAANSIRVNVEIVDILIENINATTTLVFTDLDVRLYRSDGSSIIAPTSYSIHNDYSGVPDVSVVTVSGSNVITGDITDVAPAVWSHGTRTLTTSSGGSSADDVWNHNKALTVGKFLGLK